MKTSALRKPAIAAIVLLATSIRHAHGQQQEFDSMYSVISRLIGQEKYHDAHNVLRIWVESNPSIQTDQRWRVDVLHGLIHRGCARDYHDSGFRTAADRHFQDAHRFFSQAQARANRVRGLPTYQQEFVDVLVASAELSIRVREPRTTDSTMRLHRILADLEARRDVLLERFTDPTLRTETAEESQVLAQVEYVLGYGKFWTDSVNGRKHAQRHFVASFGNAESRVILEMAKRFGIEHALKHQFIVRKPIEEMPSLFDPTLTDPSKAPAWELPDASGDQRSSQHLRGTPHVLIFYLGSGCLHCAEQLHEFAAQIRAFQASGIPVTAVSTDDPKTLKESLDSFGDLPITLVANPELDVFKAYNAFDSKSGEALHGTFVISPKGAIVWKEIGIEPCMKVSLVLAQARSVL